MTDTTHETIHWGILGTARIAEKVGAAIQAASGAELSAVASRSARRAADWARQHQVARSYGSYQELLDEEDLDAVYIPLPPSMHAEWTIRAAEAGKHVLCEKPLAMNADEAVQMWDVCRRHDRQLMDGVMWKHHPRAADMLRLIRDGSLGELRRLTSAFSFQWDVVPEDDLRLDRNRGGGSLLDLGWYCVGAATWAFDDRPQRVFGSARFYRDVDLHFSGILWFGDDRTAGFDSGFDTGMRRWFEVAGTKGSIVCDDFTKPWNPEKPRFWFHDGSDKAAEIVSETPIQEVAMVEDFCQLVCQRRLEPHWPETAIDVQRICDALDRSARSGRVVDIDWPQ